MGEVLIMEMQVHLHPDIFEIVLNGKKNVEARVNDEKRRKLKVGDTLVFLKRPLEDEIIKAKVTKLEYYPNFKELVKNYDIERLYLKEFTKSEYLDALATFYTDEEQEQYGVVAISFKIIKE